MLSVFEVISYTIIKSVMCGERVRLRFLLLCRSLPSRFCRGDETKADG